MEKSSLGRVIALIMQTSLLARLPAVLLCVGLCLISLVTQARAPQALVFSPTLEDPYFQSIFNEILSGIQEASQGNASIVTIDSQERSSADNWINQNNPDFLISLGAQSWQFVAQSSKSLPVIAGAMLSPPTAHSRQPALTVSLTPSPKQLLINLKELTPHIHTIHVVFHPEDQALIDIATSTAQKMGYHIKALPVDNLKESAKAHRQVMARLNPSNEVLWLLQNRKAVDNHLILPMVMKTAWLRKFAVVSNNFGHVKYGALFTLYPDNYRLGQHLWNVGATLNTSKDPSFELLQQTHLAVNIRTAHHLGLRFSSQQKRQFDLIFPRD